MNNSTYVKVMLTVIAACLVWISAVCAAGFFPVSAQGRNEPMEVIVVGATRPVQVTNAPNSVLAVAAPKPLPVVNPLNGSLAVTATSEWYQTPLPCSLVAIEKGRRQWDQIDVNVKQQERTKTPGH